MKRAYFNDVTLGTSYAVVVAATATDASTPTAGGTSIPSLGSLGLCFTGNLFAPSSNTGAVTVKGTEFGSVECALPAGVMIPVENLDLSKIQAKVGTSGVLKLMGRIQ